MEPFTLNSAYECNSFRWAWEQAQILTELIYHCRWWVNIVRAETEPSRLVPDWPDSPLKSMGQILFSKLHIIHTPHWKKILHERICIGIEIWCSSKIFSVSCVNIVLFKVKVWASFKVFSCPRSFKFGMKMNEKGWIKRTGFLIIKIGPGNAILELLKT